MQIKKSETQVALYAALARAQSQISVPGKNAVNPAFKSRYVDLSAVLAAVLPAWNANGLAISAVPGRGRGLLEHRADHPHQPHQRRVDGVLDPHAGGQA
jgi:hypothetical protein